MAVTAREGLGTVAGIAIKDVINSYFLKIKNVKSCGSMWSRSFWSNFHSNLTGSLISVFT